MGAALIHAHGRTGRRKVIGAFRDYANALQKLRVLVFHYEFATSEK